MEEIKEETKFDHNKETVKKACGITSEIIEKFFDQVSEIVVKEFENNVRPSEIIEILYNVCLKDKDSLRVVCYLAEPELHNTLNEILLKKFIKPEGEKDILEIITSLLADKIKEKL